jgi:hypothetical protein
MVLKKTKFDDFEVSFEETNDIRNKVYEAVLNFLIEKNAFSGEVIMQSDDCLIESPQIIAKIADDIFKFKVKYDEE